MPDLFMIYDLLKHLAPSVTRCQGQLSPCKVLEKTKDPVLRKFSDERTDRRTYRRMRVVSLPLFIRRDMGTTQLVRLDKTF